MSSLDVGVGEKGWAVPPPPILEDEKQILKRLFRSVNVVDVLALVYLINVSL